MKNWLLRNKGVILVGFIALVVLILLRISSQKSPRGGNTNQTGVTGTPTPSDYVAPEYVKMPSKESLDPQKVIDSTANKKKLADKLPIYVTSFSVSNGMKTTLNVYTIPEDPEYIIHIEIYGVNYENQDTNQKSNPNVTAFIESFQEIKKQLSSRGVDLTKMYFVFGAREYIQETATLWIKTFKLQ